MCDNVLHGRGKIAVVVDDLPPSRFPAIDVCDALLKRDVLSSESDLPRLGAYLVGYVTNDPDQGVFEGDLAARGHRGDLLPADLAATERVHGRHV